MLSKFDLDEIRVALIKLGRVKPKSSAAGLAALDRLIERERHCNYANYETFLVHLAIHNDAERQAVALSLGAEHSNEGCDLADALKDWIEDSVNGSVGPDPFAEDLIGAALGAVNWRELADELAEQVAERAGA